METILLMGAGWSCRAVDGQVAHLGNTGTNKTKALEMVQHPKNALLEVIFTPSLEAQGPAVWFFQPSVPWGKLG